MGAEFVGGAASFRVWAPECQTVSLVLDRDAISMQPEAGGYFSCTADGLQAGDRYGFRLDGSSRIEADPASRWQPEGPGGLSALVDPKGFAWTDAAWRGVECEGQVLYEMHVGTFTQEGTWRAARHQLSRLAEIGISLVEMMPIHEFFGRFGWSYDGVLLYAPAHVYGEPDDFRSFVDEAHRLGIGVILDVVYNHFGAGDRFEAFSRAYFTDRYENEWGRSLNFDGPGCEGTRSYMIGNATYWIDEFHLDGVRIDATQALLDASDCHIIAEIAEACRKAGGGRHIYLLAESEPQEARLLRSRSDGGYGLDAVWNDDFHHSAMVAATGRSEAYYHDHKGRPQEFASAAKYGYLFQGQRYDWQNKGRGTPALDLRPSNFVHFLQNHDQIANSAHGARLSALARPGRLRALTALLLLGPQTPMLFQGQEFASASRFLYFADNSGAVAATVREGRKDFLRQFPSLCDPAALAKVAKPDDPATFAACKLDWSEFEKNAHAVALHKDLIALRRTEKAIRRAARERALDTSVIGPTSFLIRYFCDGESDRLLLLNLGSDQEVHSLPDPLLAPPAGYDWVLSWSSEDPRYGGAGQRPFDIRKRWVLPADTALFFRTASAARKDRMDKKKMAAWQRHISLLD